MNKFKPWKKLPIWLAISAVVIIAGIILTVLLGFNTAAERPDNLQLEVKYDITVVNSEQLQDKLESYCEEVLKSNSLTVSDLQKTKGTGESGEKGALNYYFTSEISAETQEKVKTELETKLEADNDLNGAYTVYLAWHTETVTSATDYIWRGAIAVGVVAGLIYLGIRFGLGCALTGLALSLHDALFTLAVLAIARIPVYASAPLLYASVAALLSLALWLVHCIKLRTLKKESETPLDAETSVETAYRGAWRWILIIAGSLAAAVLLLGALATNGVRALALPLLIAVVAPLYSSLVLGPAVHLQVRRALDKFSRNNKTKYVGKEKKADK